MVIHSVFNRNSFLQIIVSTRKSTLMSREVRSSLVAISVELVYRILDHLDELTILYSVRNVCQRLNAITDAYNRYQVIFISNHQV